jgi:hypothetical protein
MKKTLLTIFLPVLLLGCQRQDIIAENTKPPEKPAITTDQVVQKEQTDETNEEDQLNDPKLQNKLETIRKQISENHTSKDIVDFLAENDLQFIKNKAMTFWGDVKPSHYQIINPLRYPLLSDVFKEKMTFINFGQKDKTARLVYKKTSNLWKEHDQMICFPFYFENGRWKATAAQYTYVKKDSTNTASDSVGLDSICPLTNLLPEKIKEVTAKALIPGSFKISSSYKLQVFINGILQVNFTGESGTSLIGQVVGDLQKGQNTVKILGHKLENPFEPNDVQIIITPGMNFDEKATPLYEFNSDDEIINITEEFTVK